MKLAEAFIMLITLSIITSFVVEQYEINYHKIDERIKIIFLLALGLLYGHILGLFYLK